MLRPHVLAVAAVLLTGVAGQYEEEELIRDPYQYQVKVEDPETANKYEIEEEGNPDIVRGSYKIALPDGRTQIVTYEVDSEAGYKAEVTYEGVAHYPDSPGYVPSAYGPPEPLRPAGLEKFKRELEVGAGVGAPRKGRKLGRVVPEHKKKIQQSLSSDLLTSSTKISLPLKLQKNKKLGKRIKNIKKKFKKAEDDRFPDAAEPQAEPLSLRQITRARPAATPATPAPRQQDFTRARPADTPAPRQQEFKPLSITQNTEDHLTETTAKAITETTTAKIVSIFIPDIYEAVPTESLEEGSGAGHKETLAAISDAVYSDPPVRMKYTLLPGPVNTTDSAAVPAQSPTLTPAFASAPFFVPAPSSSSAPAPALVLDTKAALAIPEEDQNKNLRKRKISASDYRNAVTGWAEPPATVYRSQIQYLQPGQAEQLNQGQDYEQLYQTIFGREPPVTTRRPLYKLLRKVRIPKELQEPRYTPVHTGHTVRLVHKQEGFVPEFVPSY